MPRRTLSPAPELQAFCALCPPPEEVAAFLGKLGFHLDFQMEEQHDHRSQFPPLPAQYHFKDAQGTEVIYLAGKDSPLNEDGESLPPHASRFWLYAGAQREGFQSALSSLALAFHFTWCNPVELEAPQQEVA